MHRRDFLKTTVAGAALFGMSDCFASTDKSITDLILSGIDRNLVCYDADDEENILTRRLLTLSNTVYRRNTYPFKPKYVFMGNNAIIDCDDGVAEYMKHYNIEPIYVNGLDWKDSKYKSYKKFLDEHNFCFADWKGNVDKSLIIVTDIKKREVMLGSY